MSSKFSDPARWWVRRAEAADLTGLADLAARSDPHAWKLSNFQVELPLRISRTWVALEDSAGRVPALVGGMVFWHLGAEQELHYIVVDQFYRRRGVARALLEAWVAHAKAEAVQVLFLEVRRSNVAAQNLYRSQGFEPVGVRPGYYGGEDALLWRRRLRSPDL